MRSVRGAVSAAVIVAAAPFVFAQDAAPKKRLSAEDVITAPRVGAPVLSPGGTTVLYALGEPSLESNRVATHLWTVPFEGGESKKLTDGAGESGGVYSPDGSRIAYVGRTDEGPQLFVMNKDGGDAKQTTKLLSGASGPVWSPDGKRLLFTAEVWTDVGDDAAQRKKAAEIAASGVKAQIFDGLLYRHWSSFSDGKRSQLFTVDVETGRVVQVTKENRHAPPFSLGGPPDYAWSKDGASIYYTRGPDAAVEAWSTNADLCVVASDGSSPPRSLTATNLGWDGSPCVSPDGTTVAYRSQMRDGYESDIFRLMVLDVATGTTRRVAGAIPNSIDELFWIPDGSGLIVSTQFEGSHAWYETDVRSYGAGQFWTGPNAYGASVAADGKSFVALHASLVRPAEIYSFSRVGGSFKRLTRHHEEILEKRDLPTRVSVTWKGAGDRTVQGWVVFPPDFDEDKQWPTLVFIHGGPQGAWLDAWSTRWNPAIFASAGYVVLAPNPRGSTGFGQDFCEQISGDWGGAVFEDLMRGVDAAVAEGYVDPTRLGAAGGSYGGYMVNWILGHDHRFKALMSHAGVYELDSMYGSTEELWFPEWEFKGPPWENREHYEKWSPDRFAAAFKTPTLVIHGELDYRVPVAQGMALYTALKRKGVPSRFLYYPDEGHWILKPKNSRLWNATVLEWFDRYVKNAGR